jgi:hypothetical protein
MAHPAPKVGLESPPPEGLLRLLVLSCLAALPLSAFATEATDMPLPMQGVLGMTYGGFAEFGALQEDGVRISQRRELRHDIDWRLEFAPVHGLALTLGIDQTASLAYSYPDARPMLFEPVDGGGTYLLSEATSPDSIDGSGVDGVWIGAAFSPWNERYARGQRSTLRLDAAFRTGSANNNIWIAKDNGKRGSAPGGSAIRLAGAASQDLGVGSPWMGVEFVKENALTVDVKDESGTTWAKNVELQPASTVEVRGGVEVEALDDLDQQTRVAVDFWLGFGYKSWQDVTSGVLLPNVQNGGREIAMTTSGYAYVISGISADYHINEYVRARTGPEFRFHTPYTPEHAYGVITSPDHIGVGWMLRIEGMLSLDKDDSASGEFIE